MQPTYLNMYTLQYTNLSFRVNLTNLGYKNPASSDYFESGIGKLLQNGEADLAIEYLYLTSPRVKIASPLHPIIMDGYIIDLKY